MDINILNDINSGRGNRFTDRVAKSLYLNDNRDFRVGGAPRAKMDVKVLEGTDPLKRRLRVGDYRIIYHVEKRTVKVIEIFPRGRGYRLSVMTLKPQASE